MVQEGINVGLLIAEGGQIQNSKLQIANCYQRQATIPFNFQSEICNLESFIPYQRSQTSAPRSPHSHPRK